jgi:hypothetical protein
MCPNQSQQTSVGTLNERSANSGEQIVKRSAGTENEDTAAVGKKRGSYCGRREN